MRRVIGMERQEVIRNNSNWQTACLACGATCLHYGSGRPRKYCSQKCNLSVNRPLQIKKNKTQMPRYRRDWDAEWLKSCKIARGNCLDCGYEQDERTTRAFDWDHRDPLTKCFEISNIPARTSKEQILEEMVKCDVICRNCHALRPTSYLGKPRTLRNRTHTQLDLGGLFAS